MDEAELGSAHTEKTSLFPRQVFVLSRQRFRALKHLLQKHIQRHSSLTEAVATPSSTHVLPADTDYHRLMRWLRVVPYLLGAGFLGSLFWDFEGVALSIQGKVIPLSGLLRMLSVSGLIGFLTNWLAITMLFRPRERRPVWGQGLIPAQRERVVYRLAQAISKELINEQLIKERIQESRLIERYWKYGVQMAHQMMQDERFRQELRMWLVEYIHDLSDNPHVRRQLVSVALMQWERYAGRGVERWIFRLYRWMGEDRLQAQLDRMVQTLPEYLTPLLDRLDESLDSFPEWLDAHTADVERVITRLVMALVEQINIFELIIANMEQYNEEQLERLFKSTSNDQFNYIKYVGGVLGVIGGIIIWQPLWALGVLSLLVGSLYGIDEWLYRRQQRTKPPESAPRKEQVSEPRDDEHTG